MGEIVATDNGRTNGTVVTGGQQGTSTGGTSTTTTSTTRETRGSGTGGTTRGETTEKELSQLAILTEEERKQYEQGDETEKARLLRNAKRRERYAKQKADGGQTVKPRKVKQTKAQTQSVDTTQLNAIIMTLSSIVASRPNCEHWLLSEKEVQTITEPLAKMLAEAKALETIGQYSNQIALVMACVTVFAPRLFVTVQKQKEVKKRAVTGQTTNTNVVDKGRNTQKKTTGDKKSDTRNDSNSTTNGTNNSTNEPFYGIPIC